MNVALKAGKAVWVGSGVLLFALAAYLVLSAIPVYLGLAGIGQEPGAYGISDAMAKTLVGFVLIGTVMGAGYARERLFG